MTPSDNTLLRASLAGERRAWERLIARYAGLLYSIPLRYGLSQDDAADIFQNVCVKLLAHLQTLKDDKHLTGWLILTTRRECLHVLRDNARYRARYQSADELALANLPSSEDCPDDMLIQLEQEQQIRLKVESLGQRCRTLLQLLYLSSGSASYQEVSQELNVPLGAIGPTRARCLKVLRDKLVQEDI